MREVKKAHLVQELLAHKSCIQGLISCKAYLRVLEKLREKKVVSAKEMHQLYTKEFFKVAKEFLDKL